MQRLVYISLMIILSTTGMLAQQNPHYTQYMFNDFIINPAVAGTKNYYQIRSNHRFQWVGLVDPPMTNTLSVYGPHATLDMGYGGYFYNDVTGPSSRTGLSGTYAYNIALDRDIRLSMGLSLGIMQFKIDGSQLTSKDPADIAIQPVVFSTYVPDATIGAYVYAEEFYGGFSVTQLFNNSLRIFEEKNGLNKLKSHFYITGGYIYEINREFKLEPSIIIKGTAPKVFQFDLTTRVVYKDFVWGGLSFRSKDALSILLGYVHEEKFYFGYAYDIGVSGIRKFNAGTHELMIAYKFNEIK